MSASNPVLKVLYQSCTSNNRSFASYADPPGLLGSPLHHYGHRIPIGKRKGRAQDPRSRRVAPLGDHLKSPREQPTTLLTTCHGGQMWPLETLGDRQVAEVETLRKLVVSASTKPLAMNYGDVGEGKASAVHYTEEMPAPGGVVSSPRATMRQLSSQTVYTPSPRKSKDKESSGSRASSRRPSDSPYTSDTEAPPSPAPKLAAMPPTVKRPMNANGRPFIRESAARSPNSRSSFSMGQYRKVEGVMPALSPRTSSSSMTRSMSSSRSPLSNRLPTTPE